jgi:hypothetical protein
MLFQGATSVTISPAYGRDYKSKAAALAAWEAGDDFSMGGGGGPYLSRADAGSLKERGLTSISLRYGKLRKQLIVKM